MKNSVIISLLVLSLGANGALWFRLSTVEHRLAREDADYPLGEMMGYMQRYADKLWYAGEAGNWELADFYQGEVAETAEAIAGSHVTKDGVEVSKLLSEILPPAVARVGDAIKAKDATLFRADYDAMIQSCNACHRSAQHAFIRVAVPLGPPVQWNQDFAKP